MKLLNDKNKFEFKIFVKGTLGYVNFQHIYTASECFTTSEMNLVTTGFSSANPFNLNYVLHNDPCTNLNLFINSAQTLLCHTP